MIFCQHQPPNHAPCTSTNVAMHASSSKGLRALFLRFYCDREMGKMVSVLFFDRKIELTPFSHFHTFFATYSDVSYLASFRPAPSFPVLDPLEYRERVARSFFAFKGLRPRSRFSWNGDANLEGVAVDF